MDKSIPTDRSRPHQMSHSAVASPTQYKSFAATVRSAIRSPASRDWAATIQAVTSPTKTATSASAKSKPNEKEPKKPLNKDYGFKEQVALVKKTLPLDKVKATDSFASPRPSKVTTQDNTPESKASASKGSTPTIARLGSNPYLLYQFVADQSLSQSAPNTNDKAASLTKEIEEHVKTIAEKEKEIEQLKANIQENLDKIQKQDKDLAQLNETSSINEKSLKEACEKLNIKLVQCEQQIADLKMKIEKLNEEHAKIISQMKAEESKRVSEWKDKAVELEKRVKVLESEASIHGKTNEEVQQKETEILQLKGQLTEQENEIKRMKDRNLNLEEQLARFDNDLGNMIRKSEDKLKLEISQLKGIIKTLEGEIAHYKEINVKSEQLTKEASLNNTILEEKEVKISSLEAEIRHLVSEKEVSKKNEQQINEATALINEFSRNFQIAPQSELIPALHLLLAEFAKSQERVSTENEVQTQRSTTDEHDDIVKNEFEDKIKMFQSEKNELMRKLEEAEALVNLNKNQQNEVTESVPLSDRDDEDHKHREFEFEEKISVRELIIESKEEKPKSKVVILNEGSRRSSTKSTLEPQKKKSSCELSLKSQKKYSSTLSTVSTASKAESHKEAKKIREEDPVYKQLEKMIKDLTERVVSSDQKARKIYEEKLDEISNEQYAKEQVLLEQMEKLKEEKKELLKKIDDMQWDKAYEFMKKAKEEKKQEAKPLETASKPKQAALDASKKKKKK